MNIEIEQLLEDWSFVRQNTIEFINALSEEDLKRKLSRPGIDTFMKHFEEMCDVQQAYLDACISGVMEFDCVKENDEYEGICSKEDILKQMSVQDERMRPIVEEYYNNNVSWDEKDIKTINSQLRNLCIHEALHIGQLIAFAYTMKIEIPEFIIENWSLS